MAFSRIGPWAWRGCCPWGRSRQGTPSSRNATRQGRRRPRHGHFRCHGSVRDSLEDASPELVRRIPRRRHVSAEGKAQGQRKSSGGKKPRTGAGGVLPFSHGAAGRAQFGGYRVAAVACANNLNRPKLRPGRAPDPPAPSQDRKHPISCVQEMGCGSTGPVPIFPPISPRLSALLWGLPPADSTNPCATAWGCLGRTARSVLGAPLNSVGSRSDSR